MNDNTKDLFKKINKSSPIYKIPSGFNFKRGKPTKKTKSILFVGNVSMNEVMSNLKGLKEYISAAKYFPDYKFYVVGKGDYLDKVKKGLQPNVIFTGSLFGDKLWNMFNKSEIFCNLSLSEGFGLTTAEAMSAGCAIISTIDIGQVGILVKPKDEQQLINALKQFANNPKKIKSVGASNRKLAKKYTWDNFVEGFSKIYKTLV